MTNEALGRTENRTKRGFREPVQFVLFTLGQEPVGSLGRDTVRYHTKHLCKSMVQWFGAFCSRQSDDPRQSLGCCWYGAP